MFKRKFTWIDFTIILFVVVGIIGMSYKFSKAKIAAPTAVKDSILVTVYFEYTADSNIKPIKVGDPVREQIQNANFGRVVKKESGESIFWESRDDGQLVSSGRKGYSSLRITMETQGIINKDGVSLDKSVYYVGQTISLYAGNSLLSNGRISEAVKVK